VLSAPAFRVTSRSYTCMPNHHQMPVGAVARPMPMQIDTPYPMHPMHGHLQQQHFIQPRIPRISSTLSEKVHSAREHMPPATAPLSQQVCHQFTQACHHLPQQLMCGHAAGNQIAHGWSLPHPAQVQHHHHRITTTSTAGGGGGAAAMNQNNQRMTIQCPLTPTQNHPLLGASVTTPTTSTMNLTSRARPAAGVTTSLNSLTGPAAVISALPTQPVAPQQSPPPTVPLSAASLSMHANAARPVSLDSPGPPALSTHMASMPALGYTSPPLAYRRSVVQRNQPTTHLAPVVKDAGKHVLHPMAPSACHVNGGGAAMATAQHFPTAGQTRMPNGFCMTRTVCQ